MVDVVVVVVIKVVVVIVVVLLVVGVVDEWHFFSSCGFTRARFLIDVSGSGDDNNSTIMFGGELDLAPG